MSKYTALYINLCNFTKYFLSEVLPESEPTDLIKEATKELLFAVIKYAKSIECNLTPVFVNYDNDLANGEISSAQTFSDGPNVSSSLLLCKEINGFLASKKITNDNNKHITDILLDNSKKGNVCQLKVEETLSESYRCYKSSIKKKVPQGRKLSTSNASAEDQHEIQQLNEYKTQNSSGNFTPQNKLNSANTNLLKCQKSLLKSNDLSGGTANDNSDLNFFSECFLKYVLLKDTESAKSSPSKKVNETLISKSNEHKNNACLVITSPNKTEIPLQFIELNKCLSTKLIASAFYCWKCGFAVAHYAMLENHLKQHNSNTPGSCINFSIFEICKECSFVALAPTDMRNKLLMCHRENHRSPFCYKFPRGKILPQLLAFNSDCHYMFMQDLLITKYNKQTYFPNFLGICLPCHASFSTPLEWNCHVYEFEHLLTHEEYIIKCNPCSLLILGMQGDLFKNDYLQHALHIKNCPAVRRK